MKSEWKVERIEWDGLDMSREDRATGQSGEEGNHRSKEGDGSKKNSMKVIREDRWACTVDVYRKGKIEEYVWENVDDKEDITPRF